MPIENILFPTDFSEAAGRALPHALTMAGKFDSRITALHVRVLFADDPNRPEYHFFDEGRYAEYVEDQLEGILNELQPIHRVSTAVVRDISPAGGILNYLEEHSVDLAVIGTHGRSALGRFFLGTVAEKVVRHARCPVLTVAHHRQDYRGSPSYRKILVPFDFSKYSLEAVRQAEVLARTYEAELLVLYVIDQQVHPGFLEFLKIRSSEDLSSLSVNARKALDEVFDKHGLKGLNLYVETNSGEVTASEAIVGFARENRVDLIVMGTHGLTGLEHVLLGSTTERVVRMASCPVLTAKAKEYRE
jgi:nucleotide-binding universal stress UspA family protein